MGDREKKCRHTKLEDEEKIFRGSLLKKDFSKDAICWENPDADKVPNYFSYFSKTLVHDSLGQVDKENMERLLKACLHDPKFLYQLNQTGTLRLLDPISVWSLEEYGSYRGTYSIDKPPGMRSHEKSGEYVELLWMALFRDVAFEDFSEAKNTVIMDAVTDLNKLSDFQGPKPVTGANLFRDILPGVTNGPYISQFLYYDIKYGALSTVLQKYNVASSGSGSDFMNTAALTLQVQNGTPDTSHTVGTTSRYVATPRDLASIVHSDAAAQFEHLACIILSNALSANGLPGFNNFKVPFNPLLLKGMPSSQTCFIECSVCDSLALIDKAAQLALEASWYIKWKAFLLRPEYYGLLLDEFLNDKLKLAGVFQSDVLDSKALTAIKALNPGVYAGLPQCYPEGCPGMPSWPEGHSCVAAAGATILKAFFDGTTTLPVVVEPNPSTTYTTLRVVPSVTTTVNAELNKLVSNVGIGRCIAGVHWRSDSYDAIILGEQVALRLLKDHIKTIPFVSGYRIEKFDGTTIEITNQKGSD